jgi:putative oligomerization/nucleic acid binding protein
MTLLAARDLGPYLIWLGVMMAAVIVAGVFLLILRGSVLGKGRARSEAGLLENLRSMRERGEISPEEFDAAKSAMASRMAGGAPAGPAASPKKAGVPRAGERVAPPGFDLTGRPLPAKRDEGRPPTGNPG